MQLRTVSLCTSRQLAMFAPYASNQGHGTPFGSTNNPQRQQLCTPEHSSTLRTLLLSQFGQEFFASRSAPPLNEEEEDTASEKQALICTDRTTRRAPPAPTTQAAAREG